MSDISSICIGHKAGENNVLDNMVIFGDKEGNELFSRKDPELSKVLREHVLPNLQEYWQKDLKAKVKTLNSQVKNYKSSNYETSLFEANGKIMELDARNKELEDESLFKSIKSACERVGKDANGKFPFNAHDLAERILGLEKRNNSDISFPTKELKPASECVKFKEQGE